MSERPRPVVNYDTLLKRSTDSPDRFGCVCSSKSGGWIHTGGEMKVSIWLIILPTLETCQNVRRKLTGIMVGVVGKGTTCWLLSGHHTSAFSHPQESNRLDLMDASKGLAFSTRPGWLSGCYKRCLQNEHVFRHE